MSLNPHRSLSFPDYPLTPVPQITPTGGTGAGPAGAVAEVAKSGAKLFAAIADREKELQLETFAAKTETEIRRRFAEIETTHKEDVPGFLTTRDNYREQVLKDLPRELVTPATKFFDIRSLAAETNIRQNSLVASQRDAAITLTQKFGTDIGVLGDAALGGNPELVTAALANATSTLESLVSGGGLTPPWVAAAQELIADTVETNTHIGQMLRSENPRQYIKDFVNNKVGMAVPPHKRQEVATAMITRQNLQEAFIKGQNAGLERMVTQMSSLLKTGRPTDPKELAAVTVVLNQSDVPHLQDKLNRAQKINNILRQFSGSNLAVLDDAITRLASMGEGISVFQNELYMSMLAYRERFEKALNDDPISWVVENRILNPNTGEVFKADLLDVNNPATVAARSSAIEGLNILYPGRDHPVLRPGELDLFKNTFHNPELSYPGKVELMRVWGDRLGKLNDGVWDEVIGEGGTRLVALLGVGIPRKIIMDVLLGQELAKGKWHLPKFKELGEEVSVMLQGIYPENPEDKLAVLAIVRALAAKELIETGDIDDDNYKKYIQIAMGRYSVEKDGEVRNFGGMTEINDEQVVVPSFMEVEMFQRLLEEETVKGEPGLDWTGSSLTGSPVDTDGNEVDLANGETTFVAIDNGVYMAYIKGQVVLGSKGGPYVLDIRPEGMRRTGSIDVELKATDEPYSPPPLSNPRGYYNPSLDK